MDLETLLSSVEYHSEDDDEPLFASSCDQWVETFLFPYFAPRTGSRWCDNWRNHEPAKFVLEGLWRSYEEARASDMLNAGGQSTMNWYLGHFLPATQDLTRADGTFAHCEPNSCGGIRRFGQGSNDRPHEFVDRTVDERKELLSEVVLGQETAVDRVARLLTLACSGVQPHKNRPASVFLFAGPSGCGKTELAHAIAETEYGSRDRLIRLDLGEYSHWSDVARLTGSAPGFMGNDQPQGWLTTKIIEQPASVLLLDEVEKAHKKVFDVLLGVFDAGRLTDGQDRVAEFHDTIIIMTSNLGSDAYRRPSTGFNTAGGSTSQARDAVRAQIESHFRPEFIGRLDDILQFDVLSDETTIKIVDKELKNVRLRLQEAGWNVRWSHGLPKQIASLASRPEHGARHIHRLIEEHVLIPIIQEPKGSFEFPGTDLEVVIQPALELDENERSSAF